jgi:hypothetical protein
VAAAKKVKRVRRKVNKSGTVASGPALTGAERQAQLAAAAAAAAAVSGSEAAGVSSALADYQPIGEAAAAAGGAVSSSSSGAEAAAAAALSAYQPISAGDGLEVADDHARQVQALRGLGPLEAAVHEQLQSAPAVMGGHSALEDLIAQQRQPVEAHQQQQQQQLGQQQLHHMPSLSDSAIGAALRDAVGEAVGANA